MYSPLSQRHQVINSRVVAVAVLEDPLTNTFAALSCIVNMVKHQEQLPNLLELSQINQVVKFTKYFN